MRTASRSMDGRIIANMTTDEIQAELGQCRHGLRRCREELERRRAQQQATGQATAPRSRNTPAASTAPPPQNRCRPCGQRERSTTVCRPSTTTESTAPRGHGSPPSYSPPSYREATSQGNMSTADTIQQPPSEETTATNHNECPAPQPGGPCAIYRRYGNCWCNVRSPAPSQPTAATAPSTTAAAQSSSSTAAAPAQSTSTTQIIERLDSFLTDIKEEPQSGSSSPQWTPTLPLRSPSQSPPQLEETTRSDRNRWDEHQ